MNKLVIAVVSALLIVGIVFGFVQMGDKKELEDELGFIYREQMRDSHVLFADIADVDWKKAELSENELDLYISNLSSSFFTSSRVSPTGHLISQEINQLKDWLIKLRDEGSLMIEEQEALSNNARHLHLMMKDLYLQIQDNRTMFRGVYQEDERIEKIIQENMENIIRVE